MDEQDKDLVVPIIREELHADAVPVVTGGVRVTKRVDSHDEVVEQELRRSRVEVKRIKTDRVVDGPQPVQRAGNTLIVPVVSEVLRIEKQWVVTEEIHITELQEQGTVQNKVTLNREQAQIERLDRSGNVISPIAETPENVSEGTRRPSILQADRAPAIASKEKLLSRSRSILKNPRTKAD
jgi:uncharacterized protein (TIGR02271 family)